MMFLRAAICAFLLLWTVGCQSDATVPIPTFGDVELDVVAYGGASETAALVLDEGNGGFVIEEVRAVIADADLKALGEEGEDADVDGPIVARLVTGGTLVNESLPEALTTTLPVGVYDRIRYKLKPLSDDDAPSGLEEDAFAAEHLIGRSLVVAGSVLEPETSDWNGNGARDTVPFRFETEATIAIRIDSESGFVVADEGTNYVFIALPLEDWFAGVFAALYELPAFDLTDGVLILRADAVDEGAAAVAQMMEDNVADAGRIAVSADETFDERSEVDETSHAEEEEESKKARGRDKQKGTGDEDKGKGKGKKE